MSGCITSPWMPMACPRIRIPIRFQTTLKTQTEMEPWTAARATGKTPATVDSACSSPGQGRGAMYPEQTYVLTHAIQSFTAAQKNSRRKNMKPSARKTWKWFIVVCVLLGTHHRVRADVWVTSVINGCTAYADSDGNTWSVCNPPDDHPCETCPC